MDINDLKICAYLDEAGEEPLSALECLSRHGIYNVILRNAWTGNICNASDNGHKKLVDLLKQYKVKVICIASELGKVPVSQLNNISEEDINKVVNICHYYNCNQLRVFVGEEEDGVNNYNADIINKWVHLVTSKCVKNNIKCLYEITSRSVIFDTIAVVRFMKANNISLIYDAAGILMKYKMNPFIKYWPLVKQFTAIIDVRDMKIGQGFKPVGYGDTNIDFTIRDALDTKYNGWFAIEHTLGRKHGSAVGVSQTFEHSVEALNKVLGKQ